MNIGITGGFLSGKTTFAKMLAEELNGEFWSSDAYVHELYKKEELRKIIVDNFGEYVYKGLELQNKVLSDLVFNSEENLRWLESIIHPLVEMEIRTKIRGNQKNTVFEIPLLYEKHLQDLMDVCILVSANQDVCIDRAKKRGFSKEDYFARSRFLIDEQLKLLNNPIVVKNEVGISDLKNEISRIISMLKKGRI